MKSENIKVEMISIDDIAIDTIQVRCGEWVEDEKENGKKTNNYVYLLWYINKKINYPSIFLKELINFISNIKI